MRASTRLRAPAWLLFLGLWLTAPACRPERAFIELTVSGLPAQAGQTLEVRAVLGDANLDATERFTDPGGGSATVSLWLPAGAAGKLAVTATTLSGGCTTAEGTASSVVTDQLKLDLHIDLAPPNVAECEITVATSGTAASAGLVTAATTAGDAPLRCGDRCTLRAPVGSTVSLRAQVQAPAYLSRWTGCTPSSPAGMICTLTVASGGARVGAEFTGRSCSPATFCIESPIPSKLPSGRTLDLSSVWGSSRQELWVVGSDAVVLHKRGAWWSEDLLPLTAGTGLSGLAGTSDHDVWVVGNDGNLNGLGVRWNGAAWEPFTIPTRVQLATVFGLERDSYLAAARDGVVHQWDGTAWKAGTVQQPKVDIAGIWGTGGADLWLTGAALFKHNGGNTWIKQTNVDGTYRAAIWGASRTDFWLMGLGSASLHHLNGKPMPAALPADAASTLLSSVHGTGTSDVWAVSLSGAVHHFDGTAWSSLLTHKGSAYTAVWTPEPGDVYVVGAGGELLHRQP